MAVERLKDRLRPAWMLTSRSLLLNLYPPLYPRFVFATLPRVTLAQGFEAVRRLLQTSCGVSRWANGGIRPPGQRSEK